MRRRRTGILRAGPAALLLAVPWTSVEARQALPLEPVRPSGLPVSPVFEGWYPNPDGSFTLSFGYINRNSEEIVEVPVGPGNHISPGEADRGQPTHFLPRRHYGVFTVTVPADFGSGEMIWTLDVRGERFAIPGRLGRGYEISPLLAPATGITAPALRFAPEDAEGRGPRGVATGPLDASPGSLLEIDVWAVDDDGRQVTLHWAKYRGPGGVDFEPASQRVDLKDPAGSAVTTVSFSEPGDYVLHVRAHNTPVGSAGHAQCCWTNGFVTVRVRGDGTP